MGPVALALLVISAVGLLAVPRRWAALPLIVGGCYLPVGVGFEFGPFNFYPLRVLIALGCLRLLLRREGLAHGVHGLDWAMLGWAAIAVASSAFHDDASAALVNRLGLVYTACGLYFLVRAFCSSTDDAVAVCRAAAIALVPLGLSMLVERQTGHNVFASLGGLPEFSEVRDGSVRAQGPFAHSILAGSVGGVALPLMAALWWQHRTTAIAGAAACLSMVLASGSSGPLMSSVFSIAALAMWHWRDRVRLLRWAALLGYVTLDIVMRAPAYYLLARIDLTGSSTSWHRAALIEAAFAHWPEWWLAGTDYTRHWMPYGVPWTANHIDITNYYLRMGVDGGMPLMLAFIAVLAIGFSRVGRALRVAEPASGGQGFVPWVFGAALFSQAATFVSISFFDQSVVFLYLTLATIGSMAAPRAMAAAASASPINLGAGPTRLELHAPHAE